MPPTHQTKTSLRPSRQAIKRAALALALALGVAGAADFGHGYLTTGRYLRIDRRRLCQGRFHHHRAEGLRLHRRRCWSATTSRSRPASCWPGSTTAISATALEQAQADVAAAEAAVRNLDAQIALQQPLIEQETADVAAAEANLKFAQEEQARYDDLMKTGSGTVQRAQQTDAALREKTAQLQHGKSGLLAAQRKVDVLTTERAKADGAAAITPARSSSRRR